MNKADLIEKVAKGADISKVAAEKAINTFNDSIKTALKKGQTVTLVGFGTYSVTKRAARKGRNPQTGQEIKIAARKVPRFKPGRALKDIVR